MLSIVNLKYIATVGRSGLELHTLRDSRLLDYRVVLSERRYRDPLASLVAAVIRAREMVISGACVFAGSFSDPDTVRL
jgi:hypothetical protein